MRNVEHRSIVVIVHDIRSTHNVGSLLRTAECLGAARVYLTGYSPYPTTPDDTRLPHIQAKLSQQIHKTALGAEHMVAWEHHEDITAVIRELHANGYVVAALEQASESIDISSWMPPAKVAILLGREVEGVDRAIHALCDITIEIPQYGKKESLNVVQAAAIALYCCHTNF